MFVILLMPGIIAGNYSTDRLMVFAESFMSCWGGILGCDDVYGDFVDDCDGGEDGGSNGDDGDDGGGVNGGGNNRFLMNYGVGVFIWWLWEKFKRKTC